MERSISKMAQFLKKKIKLVVMSLVLISHLKINL